MKVLVTGGRRFGITLNWNDPASRARGQAQRKLMHHTLDGLKVSEIITGDAKGADRGAGVWAYAHSVPCTMFKADWDLGRRAGPMRNQRMIDEGKPDLVVVFPGGDGTADCLRRARAAGISVLIVEDV